MGKYLCANLDKEEYLDFGVYTDNTSEDSPVCKTLEYFLATEWAKDRIVFFFEENDKNSIIPDAENEYEYVMENYSERATLNSVPKYEYVVNVSNEEYYFKASLPRNEDVLCLCPLPYILTEREGNILDACLNEKETQELGRWVGDKILVTNNKDYCAGYKLFESPYIIDTSVRRVLDGLNIVVTGTISGFTRSEIENHIRQYGGNPQNSVTRKTDFVVKADYKPGKKKLDDAAKYGIKVISEQEFFEMLGE